ARSREDALLKRTPGLRALLLGPQELLVVDLRLLLGLQEARHRQGGALLRRLRRVVALAARADLQEADDGERNRRQADRDGDDQLGALRRLRLHAHSTPISTRGQRAEPARSASTPAAA